MRSLLLALFIPLAGAVWGPLQAQATLSGPEVVQRSIRYHDPTGQWLQRGYEIKLRESRPGGSSRTTELILNPGAGKFSMSQHRDGDHISRFIGPDNCVLTLNGKSTFSAEAKDKYRLSCEGSEVYRDYYTYLWGLPMKLQDEGTQIAEEVSLVNYHGKQLLEVKVDYTEEVGQDTWYFYFHPISYALSGYRFHHNHTDENEGEYLLLEGEAQLGPLRLPAKRSWYDAASQTYLGLDEVVE